ncbi:uncharacterized protein [Anoplolepis gracilipes]|uniref:uncharacterized protein n=1 Tax=Anoplolepis gracilipes TaxID=354296 RepID=UPI003B9F2D84
MQWLHNTVVTEILTKASLDAIPKEWIEHLRILKNDEFNDLIARREMKSVWPDSLKTYVKKCQNINRLPPIQILPSKIELPQKFKIGLSQKKQHEIIHLAFLVHTQCKVHDIQTIIDLGAGLTLLQEKQYFHNFPTSNCLRETIAMHNFDIGQFLRIPFLRLACQESTDKWHGMSKEKHDEHSFHVLARAVLELYSQQNNLVLKKKVRKGTRKSQCSNFQTYIKDSLLRYDLVPNTNVKLTEKEITQLWEEQSKRLEIVEIYSGLQMMLQLPAESLILQDRLSWLHEQDLQAVIIPVMNKCISPRSYAIVSYKN